MRSRLLTYEGESKLRSWRLLTNLTVLVDEVCWRERLFEKIQFRLTHTCWFVRVLSKQIKVHGFCIK